MSHSDHATTSYSCSLAMGFGCFVLFLYTSVKPPVLCARWQAEVTITVFGGICVRPDVIHERVSSFQDSTVQGAELSLPLKLRLRGSQYFRIVF